MIVCHQTPQDAAQSEYVRLPADLSLVCMLESVQVNPGLYLWSYEAGCPGSFPPLGLIRVIGRRPECYTEVA
jgi:hypothetical protein